MINPHRWSSRTGRDRWSCVVMAGALMNLRASIKRYVSTCLISRTTWQSFDLVSDLDNNQTAGKRDICFSRLHYHHNASKIILLIIMSVTATLISKISQVFCLANEGWELVFFIILCPVAAKLLYSNWDCSQELLISGWTMYVEYFILLDKLCIHTKRMSKLYYKTLDFIKLENL